MMKELGPAARQFVESHRKDRLLTDAARARIKQKLMLQVSTLGATTAAGGTAAGMSLGAKAVLVTLAVTGAVGGGVLSISALRSRGPSHAAPAITSARATGDVVATAPDPASAAPPLRAAAAPAAPPALAPMAMPARPAAAVATPRAARAAPPPTVATAWAGRSAPRAATTPVAAPASARSVDSEGRDRLTKIDDRPVLSAPENANPPATRVEAPDPEPELRALREARDDLRAGRAASAYRRLEDFKRQNPGGMLAQERSALSAIALCEAQPGREAQARAAEFLRRSPESPLAARVKSACEPSRDDSR